MRINAFSVNNKTNFGAIYKNPNGSTVNISERAIKEIQTTASIRKSVDTAFKENPNDYYRYETQNSIASNGTKFLIDNKGKCIFVPSDFGTVKYMGHTMFGIQDGKPIEITANKCTSRCTMESYSDELGSIRAYGGGKKYAHIQPDYSVKVSYPEWAPEDRY